MYAVYPTMSKRLVLVDIKAFFADDFMILVVVTLLITENIMHMIRNLMVIVGLMLFSGIFERIAQAGQFFWVDFGL